jgi:hypothetical protein
MSRQTDLDNHANQMNPNNDEYWQSRGDDDLQDDWEDWVDWAPQKKLAEEPKRRTDEKAKPK